MDTKQGFYTHLLKSLFKDFGKEHLVSLYHSYFEYANYLKSFNGHPRQEPIQYKPVVFLRYHLNFSDEILDSDINTVFNTFSQYYAEGFYDDTKEEAYKNTIDKYSKIMPSLFWDTSKKLCELQNITKSKDFQFSSVTRDLYDYTLEQMKDLEDIVLHYTKLIEDSKKAFIEAIIEFMFYDVTTDVSKYFMMIVENTTYSTFEYTNINYEIKNHLKYDSNKLSHPYKLMKSGNVRIRLKNAHYALLTEFLEKIFETNEALRKSQNDKKIKDVAINTCKSRGKGGKAAIKPYREAYEKVMEFVNYTEDKKLLTLLQTSKKVLENYEPYTEHDILRQAHIMFTTKFYDYFIRYEDRIKHGVVNEKAFSKADELSKQLITSIYYETAKDMKFRKKFDIHEGRSGGFLALSPYVKNHNNYGKLNYKK